MAAKQKPITTQVVDALEAVVERPAQSPASAVPDAPTGSDAPVGAVAPYPPGMAPQAIPPAGAPNIDPQVDFTNAQHNTQVLLKMLSNAGSHVFLDVRALEKVASELTSDLQRLIGKL